jgi:hypothetical protein
MVFQSAVQERASFPTCTRSLIFVRPSLTAGRFSFQLPFQIHPTMQTPEEENGD